MNITTNKWAYYNEFDPKAAAWLRQLIKDGLIADGEVDERSITEVTAGDLKGFIQHHFFAGIGGWSCALRLAGWGDDRSCCTASLPCQPFSVAGAGKGKDDERHLLPYFIELVKQCNFKTIFGEQVPGAIKHGWLDDLCTEMERENYAVGSIVLTAAGTGAPHIRQRLYWVADSNQQRQPGQREVGQSCNTEANSNRKVDRTIDAGVGGYRGEDGRVVYADGDGSQQGRIITKAARYGDSIKSAGGTSRMAYTTSAGAWENERWLWKVSNGYSGMGNTEHDGHVANSLSTSDVQPSEEWLEDGQGVSGQSSGASRRVDAANLSGRESGCTEWDNPDWIYCRDNKYRPIKPGIKPLVNGLPKGMVYGSDTSESIDANNTQEARVMRLKGYGNAICPQTAASFIKAFIDIGEPKCP